MKEIINAFRYSFSLIKSRKITFIFSSIYAILSSCLLIVEPYFYSKIISCLFGRDFKNLCSSIMFLISIMIVRLSLGYLVSKAKTIDQKQITVNIKNKILEGILQIRPTLLRNFTTGKILNIITEDTMTVAPFLYMLPSYLLNIISICVVGYILLRIDLLLSLATLIVFPIIFVYNMKSKKKVKQMIISLRSSGDQYFGEIKKILHEINSIKSSGASLFNIEQTTHTLDGIRSMSIISAITQLRIQTFSHILDYIGNFVFLIMGGIFVFTYRISPTSFLIFSSYTKYLTNSLRSITTMVTTLQSSTISIGRLREVMEFSHSALVSDEKGSHFPCSWDYIDFEHVHLEMNQKHILIDLNMSFKKSCRYLVLGKNGSGKTSLLNMICSEYEAREGGICIGGVSINSIKYSEIVSNIAYARQTPIILETSVMNNLQLAKSSYTKEEVYQICKDVGIHDDIIQMSHSYDTIINEGLNLSTGQRKKIDFARCFIRKCNILLFDEPTANLDEQSKEAFLFALDKHGRDKTIIIATHDPFMLHYTDRKYNLDAGRLVTYNHTYSSL